jgi:hypothetical protein
VDKPTFIQMKSQSVANLAWDKVAQRIPALLFKVMIGAVPIACLVVGIIHNARDAVASYAGAI